MNAVSDNSPKAPLNQQPPRKIAVIGGGISGLAACYYLLRNFQEKSTEVEVSLFEASSRLGGVFGTIETNGYRLETGADMFITNKPGAIELTRELGLESRLIETDARYRRSLILRNGKPLPTPVGFDLMVPRNIGAFLKSPLLSVRGKLRVLLEYFLPARPQADETLESFVTRRLGREAFGRIIQPMIGGIYTADPAKLSLRATLPRFLEMEAQHGGLLRGVLQEMRQKKTAASASSATTSPPKSTTKKSTTVESASGARYGLFVSFDQGMSVLQEALHQAIQPGVQIFSNTVVKQIQRDDSGTYRLQTITAPLESTVVDRHFDEVLLTLPAPRAAEILEPMQTELAASLRSIPYASAAIVITGYPLKAVQHPLDAFGLVIPAVEKRQILAVSFPSRKFPNRAPAGSVQMRTFIGGALQQQLLQQSDADLLATVERELADIFGVQGPPEVTRVVRWNQAMPQYHLGHRELVQKIRQLTAGLPGLELAGNAFDGVGLPDVIQTAKEAVARLVQDA